MARYQVVIEEIVRYTVAVEADSEEAAAETAVEEFVNASSVDPYYDHVAAREVVTTIEVDADGLPVGDEES